MISFFLASFLFPATSYDMNFPSAALRVRGCASPILLSPTRCLIFVSPKTIFSGWPRSFGATRVALASTLLPFKLDVKNCVREKRHQSNPELASPSGTTHLILVRIAMTALLGACCRKRRLCECNYKSCTLILTVLRPKKHFHLWETEYEHFILNANLRLDFNTLRFRREIRSSQPTPLDSSAVCAKSQQTAVRDRLGRDSIQ